MTRSELMALMVGGIATIAGGVLAAYVGLGIDAGHLLTASVLSAPASLMMAKILVPETETSPTAAGGVAATERTTVNPLDALCHGAADGLRLSLNVLAMLIAFTAVIAATNWVLAGIVGLVGWQTDRPLQAILGWLNAPFAWLIVIPWEDCPAVGTALGELILLEGVQKFPQRVKCAMLAWRALEQALESEGAPRECERAGDTARVYRADSETFAAKVLCVHRTSTCMPALVEFWDPYRNKRFRRVIL